MNESTADRLYNLLPAIYRIRDAAQGQPLRTLLGVAEQELQVLERDIDGLYDNWFIETCDEWVVPYIGDLLGVHGLPFLEEGTFSQRSRVANTLGYRRAKGTAAVLEQLARDVTGWPAKAVEFFQLLATTQYLNHVRLAKCGTVDLRRASQLELINRPFDAAAHTADVRHVDNGRGKYNIPNVGLFVWRLQGYAVLRGTARPAAEPADGRYTFHPVGYSAPLFNRPQTDVALAQLATEINVPDRLRRRPLHDELEAARQALVDGRTPRLRYFDPRSPVLQVFVQQSEGDAFWPVAAEEILVCDLSDPAPPAPPPTDWRRPPTNKAYTLTDGGPTQDLPIKVAVDPVVGRLVFPSGVLPHQVEVSYVYGFPGDLRGGPYDRRRSLERALPRNAEVTWQMGVTAEPPSGDPRVVSTLGEAVQAWNDHPARLGVISVMDSRTYQEDLAIAVPEACQLVIVAADWPEEDVPDSFGQKQRVVGRLVPTGRRPHLWGSVSVTGSAAASSIDPGGLVIDGLLVEGSLTVGAGNLGSLRLAHSTLVPACGGLEVKASPQGANQQLEITLERVLAGRLALADTVQALLVQDSLVDSHDGGAAIVAPAVEVQSSTVLGQTTVRGLEASNSIFTGLVTVERRQMGCVRFCYLPPGSLAPRRYRCQPADATAAGRVQPSFTSIAYGQPAYGQLAITCPPELTLGADDEGEMGAFHFLQQAQRVKSLRASLDEYLPFGLEVGIFFAT